MYLFICHNKITGEIDLTQLPEGMKSLSLSKNQLTGAIDLTQLPDVMEYLSLENNTFTGSLLIRNLPQWIKVIGLQRNTFNDIAVVESKSHVMINLKGSGVISVVDESGREMDMQRFLQ